MDKRAFTLAELLTAVLVISIIMVALAPVITKRMKDNVSVTTDNKKGLEIYTNPGTYTFDVPIGINTLF
ncbi:TPA: prepilin-type N-terminal cleavage/methylation domain-containing protein, partial [Candidatus Galligastranaerophilus faecipullorum]|nr:prepilin-type N-terminal cleavage/methylation domain-containing protein [Candidatus Galligastranaerophilus faecipullorum]